MLNQPEKAILKYAAFLVIAAAVIAALSACSPTPPPPSPTVSAVLFPIIAVSKDPLFSTVWVQEVQRRFPKGAVIVFGHGKSDDNDQWATSEQSVVRILGRNFLENKPSVPLVELVLEIRREYPSKPIVLVVCNGDKHRLNNKGVYYALKNVWTSPDFVIPPTADYGVWGDGIGNIYEFVTGDTMPAPSSRPSTQPVKEK